MIYGATDWLFKPGTIFDWRAGRGGFVDGEGLIGRKNRSGCIVYSRQMQVVACTHHPLIIVLLNPDCRLVPNSAVPAGMGGNFYSAISLLAVDIHHCKLEDGAGVFYGIEG